MRVSSADPSFPGAVPSFLCRCFKFCGSHFLVAADDCPIRCSPPRYADPADKFRKNKSKSGKKGKSSSSEPSSEAAGRKSSKSGSALDRASAYLSKYKGGSGKTKSKGKKKSPAKSPGDDFSAFMDDTDDSDGEGGRLASKKSSPSPNTRRERRPNVDSITLEKNPSPAVSPRKGSSSPSLGNTMKSKFSSPTVGVLKSGSDIKDIIYRPPSPLYNPSTPGSAGSGVGNRSNVSESLEESIASFADELPARDEAMGRVMDFASLTQIAVGEGEEGEEGEREGGDEGGEYLQVKVETPTGGYRGGMGSSTGTPGSMSGSGTKLGKKAVR